MRSLRTQGIVLFFALSLLAACGGGGGGGGGDTGGGGGADSISYVISAGTTTVLAETFDLNVPVIHYDPYIYGHYIAPSAAPGSDKTYLYAYSQYNAGFKETFAITFEGKSTGGFPIGGKNSVSIASTHASYIATAGTITVNAYGAAGGRIQGTFIVTNASSTPMSGSFSVTREADQ